MNISLLIVLVSLTAFYKSKLDSISDEYTDKITSVQEATGMAIVEEQNKTLKLQEGIGMLESGYADLRSQNEELNYKVSSLEKENSQLKSELSDKNIKFDLLTNQFNQVQNSLIKANEEISSIIYQRNQLCERVKSFGEEC